MGFVEPMFGGLVIVGASQVNGTLAFQGSLQRVAVLLGTAQDFGVGRSSCEPDEEQCSDVTIRENTPGSQLPLAWSISTVLDGMFELLAYCFEDTLFSMGFQLAIQSSGETSFKICPFATYQASIHLIHIEDPRNYEDRPPLVIYASFKRLLYGT